MKIWMKTMLRLVLLLCCLTVLAYVLFIYVIGMEHYPLLLPAVPLFYFLEILFFCFVLYNAEKKGKGISLKKTMVLRIVRVVGSILLLAAGAVVDRTHLLSFTGVIAAYYLVYLIMESKIMIDVNRVNYNLKTLQ